MTDLLSAPSLKEWLWFAALHLGNLSLSLFCASLQGHLSHGTLREAEPSNHGDCTTGSTPDCSPPSPDTALKNIERVIRPQVSALTCTHIDTLLWINAAAAEASNALLSITAATYEPLKHLQPTHWLTNRSDSDWFACSVSITTWFRIFDWASDPVKISQKPYESLLMLTRHISRELQQLLVTQE